jgi:hypothetical protein
VLLEGEGRFREVDDIKKGKLGGKSRDRVVTLGY